MDNIEIAETCEKAAALLEEKGRIRGELWRNESAAYQDGPTCLVGALAVAHGNDDKATAQEFWYRSGIKTVVEANLPDSYGITCGAIVWNDKVATDEEVTTMLRDVAKKQRDNG